MLFPYAGIKKKAVDMYIEEIENSDLSTEAKMISLLNAKKTLKKLRIRRILPKLQKKMQKKEQIFLKSQELVKNGLIGLWSRLRMFHLKKCN